MPPRGIVHEEIDLSVASQVADANGPPPVRSRTNSSGRETFFVEQGRCVLHGSQLRAWRGQKIARILRIEASDAKIR